MREETLFHEVLAKSPGERSAFLERACAGHPQLRAAIESLLAAHEASHNLLDRPPVDPNQTVDSEPGQLQSDRTEAMQSESDSAERRERSQVGTGAGAMIAGRYTLMEKIGEGGMGEVWVAQQFTPVKRRVALKLIKSGMDSSSVLSRFEQERQALALMDHPNIARVLDGGVTPSGQPFFVMELVNGLPLTRFCDEARLTPRERLELFIPICQAVQHAHQKGIVHRDLKPANILVTLVDGRPVPKVIDFGVAKATGGSLTEESFATHFGAVIGTLEYMSPEQAGYSGVDVDTRADVYSLGVILYELLTGLRPIDGKRLQKAGLVEMIRVIQEVEPSKPSTRLSTEEALPSLAATRQTDPRTLMALLRGELDWVVMKCLERERARRYETASDLAKDVQRYLADEPVEARPPSFGYRLKKFVRRNKGQVIAASAILIVLVTGIIGTTWGLIEAKRQEAIARDEAVEKEKARAAEAQRVAERDIALGKEKEALRREAERADELKHRLGISQFVLANAAFDKQDVALAAERLDQVPPEQRGWGWRYLKQKADGGIFTLKDKTPEREDGVYCVAYSPDGGRIATAHIGHGKAGSKEFILRVWDARTGRLLSKVTSKIGYWPGPVVDGAGALSVSFSPDGKRILRSGAGAIPIVWDAETGAVLLELKDDPKNSHAAFSPDGTRIVTGGVTGRLRIWDAESGAVLITLIGTESDPDSVSYGAWNRSLQFSPDGKRIVGCYESVLRVWDAEKAGPALLERKGTPANSVSYSPDGTRILIMRGRTAQVLNAADGTTLLTLDHRRASQSDLSFVSGQPSAAFSPDGTRIVTAGSEEARVWDARTGRELSELIGHRQPLFDAVFSPDGTRIVTGSADGTAKVWDARTGGPRVELRGHPQMVTSVAFSPDGSRFVTSNGSGYLDSTGFVGENNHVEPARPVSAWVCDTQTGKPVLELKGERGVIQAVAFSPDGSRIATGGWRDDGWREDVWRADHSINFGPRCRLGHATVWDAKTGARLLELKGLKSGVYSVAFSPDGKHIAAGGTPPVLGDSNEVIEVMVWNTVTGTVLLDLSEPLPPKKCVGVPTNQRGASVAFSPDGARIVVAGLRRPNQDLRTMMADTPKVFDARTGKELFQLRAAGGNASPTFFWSVAVSPDGDRIAASERRTVRVWDIRADISALPIELKGHTGEVQGVGFSPDGKRIITASTDGTARVWDARTGTTLVELPGSIGPLGAAAFSPDNTRIVAGRGYSAGPRVPSTPGNENIWAVLWDVPPLATGPEPNAEELAYRQAKTEPNVELFLEGYADAKATKDDFKTKYYLGLIPERNRKELDAKAEMAALSTRATQLRNQPEELPVLKELLDLQKTHLGADHPETMDIMLQLARGQSDRDEELRLLNRRIDLMKATSGPTAPDVLSELGKLGDRYHQLAQLEQAIDRYEQVVKGYSEVNGPNHPQTINAILKLSRCYRDARRPEAAIAVLEPVKTAPINYSKVAFELVAAYEMAGDPEKAIRFLLKWQGELRDQPPPDDGRELDHSNITIGWKKILGKISIRLGEIEFKRKNWAAAETNLREAEKLLTYLYEHSVQAMLCDSLLRQQKYAEAEPLLLKSYESLQRQAAVSPSVKPQLLDTLDRLIELSAATEKPEEVKKWQAERAKYASPAPTPDRK